MTREEIIDARKKAEVEIQRIIHELQEKTNMVVSIDESHYDTLNECGHPDYRFYMISITLEM